MNKGEKEGGEEYLSMFSTLFDLFLQVPSLLWVVVPPDTALALADTTVVLP